MPSSAGTIVIPTFNSRHWLESCLPGVLEQAGDGWEVVVVDNASSDGTAAEVRARWPGVRVVELPENVGYGAAVNAGAGDGHVLALNVDTELEPGALARLAEALGDDPGLGAVGPRLLDPDGSLQPSVHELPTVGALFAEALFLDRLPGGLGDRLGYHERGYDYAAPRQVGWLTGAALLVRDAAWRQSGGFDPSFFFFVEEVDLQRRLHALGWSVAIEPRAALIHHGGKQPLSPELFLHSHEGFARYFAKHEGPAAARLARAALCLAALTRALAWTVVPLVRPGAAQEAGRWRSMFWNVFKRSARELTGGSAG
jgi:N-acetylglucosaminyl-diphospho-decaprenol L-rhamnosyltransferase